MTILEKILLTIALIGLAGCLFNMIAEVDNDNWKVHTYSTIPMFASAVVYLIIKVWV